MKPAVVVAAAGTSAEPPAGDAGIGSDPAVTAESAVPPILCKRKMCNVKLKVNALMITACGVKFNKFA